MSNTALIPYLFFTGNCKEAMEFYQSVFGGKLDIQTVSEANTEDMSGMKPDMVMHAYLSGGDATFMASDSTRTEPFGVSSISLSLNGSDETRLREIFTKLSEGGKVTSELKKEFWGSIFGSVTDKFGNDWMVNIDATPTE